MKGSNTEEFDEFGSSVALNRDGSLMAVGAKFEDSAAAGVNGNQADNTLLDSGAVYVFATGDGEPLTALFTDTGHRGTEARVTSEVSVSVSL